MHTDNIQKILSRLSCAQLKPFIAYLYDLILAILNMYILNESKQSLRNPNA